MPDPIGHPFRHSTACPWNLSSGASEAYCCYCSAGSKVRKRSGIGGLTSQLLLLVPLRGPNVGGQCSSCRFASPPPARGPRTFPFPHTSPHRSSNRRSPPLWPATPSVPAWLPSCCGGRVATKSPGKRAFPPIYRGGRPPFSHHSRRKYLPFPSCPIRSGIGNASSQVVLRNAAGLQKSFDLLRYMLLYGRFASQVGRKMQTCVTSPPNLLHFAT